MNAPSPPALGPDTEEPAAAPVPAAELPAGDPPASEPPQADPPPAEAPPAEPPAGDPAPAEPPVSEPPPEQATAAKVSAAEAPEAEAAAPEEPVTRESPAAPAAGSEAPPAVLELEELSESLAASSAPAPLAEGSVLQLPGGLELRVTRLVETEAGANVYEATLAGEAVPVSLREAAGAAAEPLAREAELLAGLDGPMFPRLLGKFEQEGKTYLATGAGEGETLADALARGELPFGQAVSILAQVAAALSRLHQQGWAHMGVRPAAIALGRPVRLIDFRHAVRLGEKLAAAFYHAGYSPPELLTGEPADVRADVYGVGALLFHVVNGKELPEEGAALSTWQPPTPVGGVPQVLARTLGPREDRYQSMAALHRALLQLARRHAPLLDYAVGAATNIGLERGRTTNQDAYVYLTGRLESDEGPQPLAMLCACDGMGGMAAGEVASAAAVRGILAQAASTLGAGKPLAADEQVKVVRAWMQEGNQRAVDALDRVAARGGATLVCACVLGRRVTAAHVGDCRMYLLRGDEVRPLTRDHSLVMSLVMQGEIRLNELRNHPDRSTVTRSLGDRTPLPEYQIDTLEPATGAPVLELETGDVLLLCSDGLWEPVLEPEMLAAVREHAPDLNAAAGALVRLALERGGPDNITAVLFRLDEVCANRGAEGC